MRVNARLDEDHANKLAYLRRKMGASISEVIKRAIDVYYAKSRHETPEARSILEKAGFVGCSEGPSDLAARYKEMLAGTLGTKHDHR